MERKKDKLTMLEAELGRYRKKVADQAAQEKKLRARFEEVEAGMMQLQMAADALIAQLAVTYGEQVVDDGTEIGWRLKLPMYDVREVVGRYEVRARREQADNSYILGVVPRDAK